jgi:hypothetical protein
MTATSLLVGLATEDAQDTGNQTLADILAKIIAAPASEEKLEAVRALLAGTLTAARPPLTYTRVFGPAALTSAWQKVVTTTASTKGLRVAPLATATTFDIEWISVAAGASAPNDTYGEPVLGGEDFAAGLPIGDIYLKSATGQVAIVKTGA